VFGWELGQQDGNIAGIMLGCDDGILVGEYVGAIQLPRV